MLTLEYTGIKESLLYKNAVFPSGKKMFSFVCKPFLIYSYAII